MSEPEPCNTLHVAGIPDSISSDRARESLYLLFSTYGEVIDIKLNFRTFRHRAFVTMATVDSANLARIALDKQSFFNSPLNIRFSNSITNDI
ncbi:similar to Saccharomyces cerevisiae YIR009W MSL1 U2B component of U2 snRNP [Maudiozyma saulgeensis]|uniref:Similar to Saccharomyces cerevisiae YIR009W MSL1 U2B component of U2 snRNP n=1 Tax=Maudiozyma saulgeensis TaxID=1789683 RepID=A0A1X7QW94_9SACH|nr:similar to Saccharomyces cerevisiae YIR009W MSL1 U2B component of U2 snRNP [Kazachstania saulgeensis]